MSWYETLDREVVYEGVLSDVRIDRVRMPDGEIAEREVVLHDDAVGVVPLDDTAVVLLRHYRQPVERYLLEIPAGKLDREDEGREEAARRELREETGLRAAELEPLVTFHNSAGWSDESTHLYVARGIRAEGAPEGFEASGEETDLELVRLDLADAVAAVADGTITDAKTIIGLLLVAGRR